MLDVTRVVHRANLVPLAGGASMWSSFEHSARSSPVSCCGRLSAPASKMFSGAGSVEFSGSSLEQAPTLRVGTLGVGTPGARDTGCLKEVHG